MNKEVEKISNEIERIKKRIMDGWQSPEGHISSSSRGALEALNEVLSFLDTLEVKEVNIADMADDYYDALMEEESDWMDEGTMGHCRLAYYNGCKDVLNKLQKGE